MANRERFLSKVIVRNLPLSLDEAAFKQIIGESTCASIDLFYYVQGKAKAKSTDVPSRAYLNFINQEALLAFSQKIDGHAFLDSKGSSTHCSVEYAMSQLRPKKATGGHGRHQAKPDPLVGTIEGDEHYKAFLAELAAPIPVIPADVEPVASRGLTPLLLAIKEKDRKLEEKLSAKKMKKKSVAKAKKVAARNAKRKAAKLAKKKEAAGGPQFGSVKVLQSAATPHETASTPASSAATEPKRRRQRKPKAKPAGGDAATTSSASSSTGGAMGAPAKQPSRPKGPKASGKQSAAASATS